jgi:hypothetical protein
MSEMTGYFDTIWDGSVTRLKERVESREARSR